jgi:hypothetical protein
VQAFLNGIIFMSVSWFLFTVQNLLIKTLKNSTFFLFTNFIKKKENKQTRY